MGLRATGVLALGCLATSAWAEGAADRILVGGRVLTVDARAAQRSITIRAAHQTFMDDITGSLEPGKRADVAAWDTDFHTTPTDTLKDASCHMTIFDGNAVHRSDWSP